MAVTESDSFSIGRVASTTFSVIGRNLVTFLLLALIASAPMAYLSTLNRPAGQTPLDPAYLQTAGVSFVLAYFLGILLQAALTYSTILDLNGERPSLGKALMVALKSLLPLIVLGIVMMICLMFASILLIVPGIMLAMAWSVAVPAYVGERPGIFGAFKRSAELTKGYRWSIFGLLVIYIVIVLVIALGQGVAQVALSTVPYAPFILQLIYQTVISMVSATGYAAVYYVLRSAKEGVGPQQIAAVFS